MMSLSSSFARRTIAGIAIVLCAYGPALAADNFTAKDAAGTVFTLKSKDVGAGVEAPQQVPSDATGVPYSSGNPLPISASSLPLPAGAASAAKQPALGTAGSPSADVISVQGVASGTALKTDPSGVNSPVTDAASSATGAAVPAKASYLGANAAGNLTGLISCASSQIYDASTSGSTELVALSAGKTIYVCGYTIMAAGTVNVELDYGTGTACATGTTKIVPAYQLTAQAGAVDGSAFYRGLKTAASNALCLKTSAAIAVQAIVYYTQF